VLVDTVKPDVRASVTREGEHLAVNWEVANKKVDNVAATVEYRQGDSPWMPLPALAKPDVVKFRPKGTGPVQLRVRVKDLAGNEGIARVVVPAEEK
jgi:hypothetical protein